jgi:hypothetical protein
LDHGAQMTLWPVSAAYWYPPSWAPTDKELSAISAAVRVTTMMDKMMRFKAPLLQK